MYRRRRPKREIPFSFDSFLDLVANVCGIIIRLILVAFVGARSYHAGMAHQTQDALPDGEITAATSHAVAAMPPLNDPLEPALERHREELERQQQRLLEQLRQCQLWESANAQAAEQIASLSLAHASAEQQQAEAKHASAKQASAAQAMDLSLTDLEKRSLQLAKELRELEALPPLSKTLRYRTPVSRPVHTEELHFECQGGRVSFIDVQAFQIEMRQTLDAKANLLRTQWQVEGTTGVIGAFRMQFVVERDRGLLGGGTPDPDSGFRYGVGGWVVEPIVATRGESAPVALAPNSEFHRLADAIDPDQTVVTMWVYEDSFTLYRELRDFLHERNIEVAGRPLPLGMPIASSRRGSASRGQ